MDPRHDVGQKSDAVQEALPQIVLPGRWRGRQQILEVVQDVKRPLVLGLQGHVALEFELALLISLPLAFAHKGPADKNRPTR